MNLLEIFNELLSSFGVPTVVIFLFYL
ncbi:hypothetical protein MUY_000953 [Bacillus licheniformis WX-02]|nr:hypothetical protein MUY_000953 [Bacillus licheniformis WX-02]